MSAVSRWGKVLKNETQTIRGDVQRPDSISATCRRGCEVVVTGKCSPIDKSWLWAFEVSGPGGLSARSFHVYPTAAVAMQAAERIASAMLDLVAEVGS